MDQKFAALSRFVRTQTEAERCDLCGIELQVEHTHLIEPATRQIQCACTPCSILFSQKESARFKRIPRTVTFLRGFQLTDAQWDSLNLPIQLAFFFHSSVEDRLIALYPSPAGATESALSLNSWEQIFNQDQAFPALDADVEALLANRIGAKREYFIAPIDECFRLVGLIRSRWRGFSGGRETWETIEGFFDELKQKAPAKSEVANARA